MPGYAKGRQAQSTPPPRGRGQLCLTMPRGGRCSRPLPPRGRGRLCLAMPRGGRCSRPLPPRGRGRLCLAMPRGGRCSRPLLPPPRGRGRLCLAMPREGHTSLAFVCPSPPFEPPSIFSLTASALLHWTNTQQPLGNGPLRESYSAGMQSYNLLQTSPSPVERGVLSSTEWQEYKHLLKLQQTTGEAP